MKRASITKINNKKQYVLNVINTMVQGGGVASEPYLFLDESISFKELAIKLLEVLELSKVNVEYVNDWKLFRKNYLKLMQVKTFKELYTDSINLGVLKKDGLLKFYPTKNMGSRKGFQYSKKLQLFEISDNSAIEEIAKVLEEALLSCE